MNSREAYRIRVYIAGRMREDGYRFDEIAMVLRISTDDARKLVARRAADIRRSRAFSRKYQA